MSKVIGSNLDGSIIDHSANKIRLAREDGNAERWNTAYSRNILHARRQVIGNFLGISSLLKEAKR